MNKKNINENKIASIYDAISELYEEHRIYDPNPCDMIDFPLLKKLNLDLSNKKILDAGCGSGFFIKEIIKSFEPKELIGIDISEKMLKLAKKRLKYASNITLKQSSVINTGLKPSSIDYIFSIVVLDYVEDVDKVFLEFKRILKKNGEAYVTVRHPVRNLSYLAKDGKDNYFEKGWHEEKWPGTGNMIVYHYYRPISDWINSIINSGLKLVKVIETKPEKRIKINYPDFYNKYLRLPRGLLFSLKK